MRVIVAGGRFYNDYEKVKSVLDRCPCEISAVVCGMARGADMLGYQWAREKNIPILKYPADWDKYGKAAGHIRNKEMAENADVLIAFWDGESRGTKNMIDIAREKGIITYVFYYKVN